MVALLDLPYDVLLNVACYLELRDIHAIQLTCHFLNDFCTTRPVYFELAYDLLRRCRPLQLKGLQRVTDLSTQQLIDAVNKATHREKTWPFHAPQPISHTHTNNIGSPITKSWYKIVHTPPNEVLDYLTEISSDYMLCGTKSGKVILWDLESDSCFLECAPGDGWCIWKCKVDYEMQTVFFLIAREKNRDEENSDSTRVTDFRLMQINFQEKNSQIIPLYFATIGTFHLVGPVLNIFILDTSSRLLCALIWILESNNVRLGMYVVLDWNRKEYVFVDTGLHFDSSLNWCCSLAKGNIIVHSVDSHRATQHSYPISTLTRHIRPMTPDTPSITSPIPKSIRLLASSFLVKSFSFVDFSGASPSPPRPVENSHSDPTWYVETPHFVRQWWPTLHGINQTTSAVFLMVSRNPGINPEFVVAHHYFNVPLRNAQEHGARDESATASLLNPRKDEELSTDDSDMMRVSYVTPHFEIVCVRDGDPEIDRQRPLIAVDFGIAVWIEYTHGRQELWQGLPPDDLLAMRLRFVTLPALGGGEHRIQGQVHTLETPEELDLASVDTISVDQSQGTVYLALKEGSVFILSYK